jgi:quercetin dioxygenase-like cupin family protein
VTDQPAASPPYEVKSIETVVAGSDVRARLYTLAPQDVIPWHFHSEITDWYFCLSGKLSVETRAPGDCRLLDVGAAYTIPPKTAHRISNGGDSDCRFLLLQGVGQYDFRAI